jgi:carbamate kinase
VKPTAAKPWRRVVPSPDPIGNVEAEAINVLVDAGVIVIASGGGGIPVYRLEDGTMKGVEAVIDKDLSGERLGECVKATQLMILTDVEQACVDFGKPTQRGILNMKVEDATGKYKEHFLAGSMGPKVRACVRFLEWGGEKAIITSLEKALEALKGETGTTLTL